MIEYLSVRLSGPSIRGILVSEKGSAITTFSQALTLVAGLLCLDKRLSYRRLRKEFGLDDETLEDVRRELNQPATGPGDRFSVFHSHRGDLHQTPLRQFLDQDVRQVRLRAPH
jgi:hypothetical protein